MMNDRPSASEAGWANCRVLVTGANGFIGQWLVRALIERGAVVSALMRAARDGKAVSSKAEASFSGVNLLGNSLEKDVEVIRGEITDLALVSRVVSELKIDLIYHLAASNVNTGAKISPYDLYESNIRGVYTVLEAARMATRAVRVVVASSKEAEDCFSAETQRKFHPYMASKAAAEMIVRTYADTYGVAAATLRLGNIYGGGDYNWNRLIPGTIQSILRGERVVIRGDGRAQRDYVYVEDAVTAFLALGERLGAETGGAGVKGKLFRIASGSSASVFEVVQMVMRAAGVTDGDKEAAPEVLNQVTESRIDTHYDPVYERTALGWKPQYSLGDGVGRTWEWYKSHILKQG